MAERDRAAVDVDLRRIDVERLQEAQHHRGERFVDLEQIDVGDAHARTREHLLGHVDRAGEHDRRLGADIGEGADAGARLRPSSAPASLEPSSTAAAPSTMPDELPAWWTWLMRSTSGCAWMATASKPPCSPIIDERRL